MATWKTVPLGSGAGGSGVMVVAHGTDPNVVRPVTPGAVQWVGEADPLNAVDGDLIVRTQQKVSRVVFADAFNGVAGVAIGPPQVGGWAKKAGDDLTTDGLGRVGLPPTFAIYATNVDIGLDCQAEASHVGIGATTASMSLYLRGGASAFTDVYELARLGDGALALKRDGAWIDNLAAGAVPWPAAGVRTTTAFRVVGGVLTAYVDGLKVLETVDPTPRAAGWAGCRYEPDAGDTPRLDSFAARTF